MNYIIEIATTDFITTKAAVEGGADRIELCAGLVEGGTTPSYGMIKKCREAFSVELFPIIRPRGGDFLYTADEFDIMVHDVLVAKSSGCDGIVVGLLQQNGSIDVDRTSKLVDLAYPLEVTFHRAFDRCRDPLEALNQLRSIGCTRILTSGQQPAAFEGKDLIAKLVEEAAGDIIIMPGSGVRLDNIREIARATGAVEFHTSLRRKKTSEMQYRHPAFSESEESYNNPFIDPSEIKQLRLALTA